MPPTQEGGGGHRERSRSGLQSASQRKKLLVGRRGGAPEESETERKWQFRASGQQIERLSRRALQSAHQANKFRCRRSVLHTGRVGFVYKLHARTATDTVSVARSTLCRARRRHSLFQLLMPLDSNLPPLLRSAPSDRATHCRALSFSPLPPRPHL